MPLTRFFMLGALAGAVGAIFFGARRQRAEAIREKVERQDWESAPVKPAAGAATLPSPEQVAEEITASKFPPS